MSFQNSGHTQTESFRQGLHGPYALWFTTGGTPSVFGKFSTDYNSRYPYSRGYSDTSFWAGLPVNGFVAQSGRGRVTGTATGIPSQFNTLISVGFSNGNNEYW